MDIAALAEEHVSQGGRKSHRQLAQEHGLSYHAMRGRIRRYVAKQGKPPQMSANGQNSPLTPQKKATHRTDPGTPVPALYTPYPPTLDDTALWDDWKKKRCNAIPLTVMCWYDLHIPDHSEAAIKLAEALGYVVQPEVIIFGGDMFDFDALGSFLQHPARIHRNPYTEIQETWNRIIDNIFIQLPRVKIVAFAGNHEARREKWHAKSGGLFYDTNERDFVNIVRSNNRVWWLGQVHETTAGEWIIKHGERYGMTAVKTALMTDLGGGTTVTQGHNHYPSEHVNRQNNADGSYRVVQSMTSGALCSIPPHYQANKTRASRWVHSQVIGHVNLQSGDVALQNCIFHRKQDGTLYTYYGMTYVDNRED